MAYNMPYVVTAIPLHNPGKETELPSRVTQTKKNIAGRNDRMLGSQIRQDRHVGITQNRAPTLPPRRVSYSPQRERTAQSGHMTSKADSIR